MMRSPTRPFSRTALAFTLLSFCCYICSSAASTSSSRKKKKSCKQGSNNPDCTPDVEITFDNEKMYLVNVDILPMEDIDDLFSIQKDWIMNYFREEDRRRLRGLQDRRRDSRDISTEFTFTRQTTTADANGKTTNEVEYSQTISFLPSRRRNLVEVNVDNTGEVYEVSTRPYRDVDALNQLTSTLRNSVDSLSSMDGIYKLFDPVRAEAPVLECGESCQTSRRTPYQNTATESVIATTP